MMHTTRPAPLLGVLALGAGLLLGGASLGGEDVSVTVTGLRNDNGQVLACITANAGAFPDCRADPAARKLAMRVAGNSMILEFGRLPPGTYAVSLFHDENLNGRLDKVLMMPREGFGFSRDAKVSFGPPRFSAAAFAVGALPVHQSIRIRYMF